MDWNELQSYNTVTGVTGIDKRGLSQPHLYSGSTPDTSTCCDAPVHEHRPEDDHSRCTRCGEMSQVIIGE